MTPTSARTLPSLAPARDMDRHAPRKEPALKDREQRRAVRATEYEHCVGAQREPAALAECNRGDTTESQPCPDSAPTVETLLEEGDSGLIVMRRYFHCDVDPPQRLALFAFPLSSFAVGRVPASPPISPSALRQWIAALGGENSTTFASGQVTTVVSDSSGTSISLANCLNVLACLPEIA